MNAVGPVVLAGPTLDEVDLVAVDRVRAGIPTDLTEAERRYVLANLVGGKREFEQIARGLSWTPESVRQNYYRRRRRERTAPT